MTIIYMGNFLPTHSTETHISKTLTNMGHTVIEVQENFTQSEHLAQRLRQEEFDLFLFTRTWGETLKMDHLDILREREIPSASFHLDLYVGLKRDGGLGADPFWATNFVFTPDGDKKSAKFFKKLGINHFYLKPGVFEEECYIFNSIPDKDVIFVGSRDYHPEWPYRPQLVDWLKNTYREGFEHWGPQGLGEVRGEELNRLYGRTRVVVGDSLHLPNHDYYWSDRVYETLGRGGFLIHPYIKGLEEEFEDGKDLVFYKYGDFDELAEKIYYYMYHDEEREAIRQHGHNNVKAKYTYTQRMEEMLKTIAANTKPKNKSENEVV